MGPHRAIRYGSSGSTSCVVPRWGGHRHVVGVVGGVARAAVVVSGEMDVERLQALDMVVCAWVGLGFGWLVWLGFPAAGDRMRSDARTMIADGLSILRGPTAGGPR